MFAFDHIDQRVDEFGPHFLNPFCHASTLNVVLFLQLVIHENGLDNTATMTWWTGIHGTDHQAQFTQDSFLLVFVTYDHTQGSTSFAVQAKVFGKTLGQNNGHSLRNSIPKGCCVSFRIPRGKSLICAVYCRVSLRCME